MKKESILKKMAAFAAAAAMLITSLGVTNVMAEQTDDSVIFELGWTQNEDGTATLYDVTDNYNVTNVGSPLSVLTVNGVRYLKVNNDSANEWQPAYRGNGFKAVSKTGKSLLNQSGQSIEFWTYINDTPTNQARLTFAMVEDTSNGNTWRNMIYDKYFYYRTGLSVSGKSVEKSVEIPNDLFALKTWNHVVMTRELNADGTAAYDTYINGVKSSTLSGTTTGATTIVDESDAYFEFAKRFYNSDRIGDIKIYNRVLGASEAADLYNSEMGNYTTTFTVKEAPGTIYNRFASINVVFNNKIDSSTLGAVTLERADGTEIPGGYTVSVTNNSKQLEVKTAGSLQDGKTYTLNIGSGLKSQNGIAFEGAAYTFVAKGDIVNEDFQGENFTVDSVAPDVDGLLFGGKYQAPKIGQTASGDKYISFQSSAATWTSSYAYSTVDSSILDNYNINVRYKVRDYNINGGATTSNMALGRLYNKGIENGYQFLSLYGGTTQSVNKAQVYQGVDIINRDEEGFVDLQYTLTKDSSSVGMAFYDKTPVENNIGGPYNIDTKLDNVESIWYGFSCPNNSATLSTDTIQLSSVHTWLVPKSVKILKASNNGTDEFSLVMSEDIDTSKLDECLVSIGQGEESIDAAIVGYNSETRELTVKAEKDVKPNEDCYIYVDNIYVADNENPLSTDIQYNITLNGLYVNGIVFENGNGEVINALQNADAVTMKVDVTNYSDVTERCDAVLAVYDKAGVLKKVVTVKNTEFTSNENKTIEVKIEQLTVEDGMRAKAFVLDGIENLKPISKFVELPYCL